MLLPGGRAGRDAFQTGVNDLLDEDKKNKFGTDIYVNIEDRNNPATGALPNGDRVNVPGTNSGTIIIAPMQSPPPQPNTTPEPRRRP